MFHLNSGAKTINVAGQHADYHIGPPTKQLRAKVRNSQTVIGESASPPASPKKEWRGTPRTPPPRKTLVT